MDEYQLELVKEIKTEAEKMGDRSSRILCLCDILLKTEEKLSEVSPEKKQEVF